jgi:hypothetical protein
MTQEPMSKDEASLSADKVPEDHSLLVTLFPSDSTHKGPPPPPPSTTTDTAFAQDKKVHEMLFDFGAYYRVDGGSLYVNSLRTPNFYYILSSKSNTVVTISYK